MNKSIFFVIICAFLLDGCTPAYEKTAEGYEFIIFSKSHGKNLAYGNFIEFHLTETYKNDGLDTVLLDTRKYVPRFTAIDSANLPPAYIRILEKASNGDSITMKISVDSVFKQPHLKLQSFMAKGGFIYTTIKILNVFNNKDEADSAERAVFKANEFMLYKKNLSRAESEIEKNKKQIEEDSKLIKTYLDKNNIKYSMGKWGTFIVIRDTGSGVKINYNNVVAVNYTGKTFEGKIFNSNTDLKYEDATNGPYEVTMSKVGSVIPGWTDALMEMNEGAKATIYIPSSLAYGKKGFSPLIKPNENIVFDIEVIKMITEIQAMEIMSEKRRRAEAKDTFKIKGLMNK